MNRKSLNIVWCVVLALGCAGGCTSAEQNDLVTFFGDFLRSALAAFLF